VGHDRGGRVAHRLALDHPQCVERLGVIDIVPTLDMYDATDMRFARAYYHWFHLIQPAPLPETMIGGEPVVLLRWKLAAGARRAAYIEPEALSRIRALLLQPEAIHGACEDYRASAGIDLEHDRASRERGDKVACDMLVLWGTRGVIQTLFDPLALWRAQCSRRVQGRALPSGTSFRKSGRTTSQRRSTPSSADARPRVGHDHPALRLVARRQRPAAYDALSSPRDCIATEVADETRNHSPGRRDRRRLGRLRRRAGPRHDAAGHHAPQRDLAAAAAAAGSAPASRAEVKAGTKTPVDVPRGEAQASRKHRQGGAVEPKTDGESRADVKAETDAAAQAGQIPRGGRGGLSGQHPRGAAVGSTQGQALGTAATRAAVKSDASSATRAGDIPKGEADVKIKP
jgi:hypothetical protein